MIRQGKSGKKTGKPSAGIRQSVQDNPDLAYLSHQVMLEQTPQGLRIQLVDQDGRPMFQQGNSEPMPYTKKLLAMVGQVIDTLPNHQRTADIQAAMTMARGAGNCQRLAPMPRAPCYTGAG